MAAEREFEGKAAIVTGGAMGIWYACSESLARGGARVVIADINEEAGSRSAANIKAEGGEAIFTRTDVSHPDDVRHMVDEAVRAYGRLDIAVNNAGIGGERAPTGSYSIEGWQKVIDTNLNSVFYCMRYEIPRMLERGGGAIVNMTSILGSVGFANSPAYAAAKHGVVGLTQTAALEYAKQGIRINSVAPGFIVTPMIANGRGQAARASDSAAVSTPIAMGRMGTTQEVADLVAFLCSDKASFITGGYYVVDGGYTAQ